MVVDASGAPATRDTIVELANVELTNVDLTAGLTMPATEVPPSREANPTGGTVDETEEPGPVNVGTLSIVVVGP